MKSIPAGKFKASCLQLMDEVQKTKDGITITKHGKPVARLVPVSDEGDRPIFGYLQNCVRISGDLIESTGEAWDADQ